MPQDCDICLQGMYMLLYDISRMLDDERHV